MQANFIDRLSLGTIYQGQGTQNAVESAHRPMLRALAARLASKLQRGLLAWLGHWLALAHVPGGVKPGWAMCPITADRRRGHREAVGDRRSTSVVTRGTVGAC